MDLQPHSTKLLAELLNKPAAVFPNPHAPPAYTVHPTVEAADLQPIIQEQMDSDPSDTSDEFSPISFTIHTPLTITGNGNLLALSPPALAASIAEKIIKELKGASMTDGIPMIDENGRPRPIEVVVEAPLIVRGNGNVVGEREVLGVVARNMRRQSAALAADAGGNQLQKGKRAASEPAESSPSPKRERMD